MTLEYQCSIEDYKNFVKDYFKTRFKKTIILIIIIAYLIGDASAGTPFNWIKFICLTALSGFLLMVIMFVIPYFISLRRINKQISQNPQSLEKRKLTITEEGLMFEYPEETLLRKWESFLFAKSGNDFLEIKLVDKTVLLIPKKAFASHADLTNFLGLVQNKIIYERRSIKGTSTQDKERPPYLLGLICLIPVFGAMAGIVFTILGLTRYKDKWLTLIGVSGILITLIIFLFLSNTMNDMSYTGEGARDLSQTELTNMVRDIEYYKLLNGQYPDSLPQVFKKNDRVKMYDPVQSVHLRKNITFNYEKVNDKYRLFSSGDDGIPDTQDDIYPQLTEAELNKTGWLKNPPKPVGVTKQ